MSEEEFETETDMGDSPAQGEGSVTLSRRERRQLQREERRAQREIEQTTVIEETGVDADDFGEEEFGEEEFVGEEEQADSSLEDLREARLSSQARRASAERLLAANSGLERAVVDVVEMESNSLIAAEQELMEAKHLLSSHKLRKARKSVERAEKNLSDLEEEVLKLRRTMATLHRLVMEKEIAEYEIENILTRLRNATSSAEHGNVSSAANEIEILVEEMIDGNVSTLNPFLFRHFWMGVTTRWPAGGDIGVLVVRIINDGPITLPVMRMEPPVPEGWICTPKFIDVPAIRPGGNMPVKFEISAQRRYGADEVPLSRKLGLSTAYEVRSGEVMCTIRAESSFEPLHDVIIAPWIPPGFKAPKAPFFSKIEPGSEPIIIRMPLSIDLGPGGAR